MDENGNVSRSLTFYSFETKQSLLVDLYGRFIGLTIFEAQSPQPKVKAILDADFAVQIRYLLNKTLKDREAKPFGMSFLMWNRDKNAREFRCGVTVGRDVNDKAIYLDISSERQKDPIRFFLSVGDSYLYNDQQPSRLISTEAGARSLVEALEVLSKLLFERGNEKTTETDKSFKPAGDPQIPAPPPIGDDVGF